MNLHAFTRRAGMTSSDVSLLSRARDPGLEREFHRWPLPGYVWPALERRYHSIFCSEPQLRIHGSLTSRIEAWVSRRNGHIKTLVLFERIGRCARVLNEVFDVAGDELREFADAVFAQHRELQAISINSAFLDAKPSRYPCWSVEVSEDYQLSLPHSAEDWLASLSSQTREKFRAHLRRAQRRQPGFVFRTMTGSAIGEAQVRRVIELNRARMMRKGRRFGMSEADQDRLLQMMHERGLLSVIEIDGELRAGLLCTLAGDDIYMHVIAHDPQFDELRLGFLCCALTIQDAIDRRLRRFHFLWGRYDYKTQLGGERRSLSRVLLLRGPAACLIRSRLLLAHLFTFTRAWLRRQRQA